MSDHSEAFVAFDTSKLRNAVAIADGGRGDEVLFLGEFDNTPAATAKLVRKLAAKYERLTFCYEAGPTGYGAVTQAVSAAPAAASARLRLRPTPRPRLWPANQDRTRNGSMLIGNAVTREPAPGQGPVKLNLVQRRERNHGRGIPDMCLRPIARSTPVFRQEKPQTDIRTCVNPRIRACYQSLVLFQGLAVSTRLTGNPWLSRVFRCRVSTLVSNFRLRAKSKWGGKKGPALTQRAAYASLA